ncbi:MAG: PPC domain-containing protein [bacterium]
MKVTSTIRSIPVLVTALTLAACVDATNPAASRDPQPALLSPAAPAALVALTCTASPAAKTVRCGPSTDSGVSRVIIGGQGQFVTLASSNIQTLADTFAFDVTVRNLVPRPIGTADGTAADAAGVRVFFHSGPVASPSGTVTVANPDGTGTFTGSGQPYYQYAGLLATNTTSAVKRWKLVLTPDVTSFTFTVYVSAEMQYSNGYIDGHPYVLTLNPGESVALPGVVRTAVGTAQPAEVVSWVSDATGTASVSGTQVTAGGSRGFATLTPSSGARPGLFLTAVSVCAATVVTNGTTLPSSIASSDCFSSYHGPNDRPTVGYYADLYRVTLTAGQTIEVTMDSGNNLDTYLSLAGPADGRLVAANDDDNNGSLGVGSRMNYTATVAGVYVIEATTYYSFDQGTYTLHVSIQ